MKRKLLLATILTISIQQNVVMAQPHPDERGEAVKLKSANWMELRHGCGNPIPPKRSSI